MRVVVRGEFDRRLVGPEPGFQFFDGNADVATESSGDRDGLQFAAQCGFIVQLVVPWVPIDVVDDDCGDAPVLQHPLHLRLGFLAYPRATFLRILVDSRLGSTCCFGDSANENAYGIRVGFIFSNDADSNGFHSLEYL